MGTAAVRAGLDLGTGLALPCLDPRCSTGCPVTPRKSLVKKAREVLLSHFTDWNLRHPGMACPGHTDRVIEPGSESRPLESKVHVLAPATLPQAIPGDVFSQGAS